MQPSEIPTGERALIAILRGVVPERVVDIANALYGAGIRIIEVPLNSPDPFASITALATRDLPGCLIGAGTVLNIEQVRRTHDAGGLLVVAPNCEPDVISAALQLGMHAMPGFATATEAFSAIRVGATHLKLFPASTYGPRHLQALRAVLPSNVRIFPVGGIGALEIPGWLAAGAAGFGLGSELYRPEYGLADIEQRARHLMTAFHEARAGLAEPTSVADGPTTARGNL
jgi:2-dehydro-3-deoxyphosphogalactonate aldolase